VTGIPDDLSCAPDRPTPWGKILFISVQFAYRDDATTGTVEGVVASTIVVGASEVGAATVVGATAVVALPVVVVDTEVSGGDTKVVELVTVFVVGATEVVGVAIVVVGTVSAVTFVVGWVTLAVVGAAVATGFGGADFFPVVRDFAAPLPVPVATTDKITTATKILIVFIVFIVFMVFPLPVHCAVDGEPTVLVETQQHFSGAFECDVGISRCSRCGTSTMLGQWRTQRNCCIG
jgi:hypothetical protein